MNARTHRAGQIMETKGHCSQIDANAFSVRSQTNPENRYTIRETAGGLVCECPDNRFRKVDCKHIKIVLEVVKNNRCRKNNTFRIMERSQLKLCKYCDSGRLKNGTRKTAKENVQRCACLDRKKRLTANFGCERMRHDPRTIIQAIQMYYQGMSVRDIECNFEMMGIDVEHSSVYDWIAKYSKMTSDYLNEIIPGTNGRTMVGADEIWIKNRGEQKYLFASMDDDTRYWLASDMAHTKFQHNADNLLELTKEKIGKNPAHFATDGLPAYMKSRDMIRN